MEKSKGKRAPHGKNTLTGRFLLLKSFSGVLVKISTLHGVYLFTARIHDVSSDAVMLSFLHGPEYSDLQSGTAHLLEAELRGYNKLKYKAVRARGLLQHVSGALWRLTRISFADSTDERRDYRQKTDFEGTVTFLERRDIVSSCQVADMSMGGVCLLINRPTAVGERIQLRAEPLAEAGIASLDCLVCYNRFDDEENLLCGCRFDTLHRETRQNLARLMLRLQLQGRAPGKN